MLYRVRVESRSGSTLHQITCSGAELLKELSGSGSLFDRYIQSGAALVRADAIPEPSESSSLGYSNTRIVLSV